MVESTACDLPVDRQTIYDCLKRTKERLDTLVKSAGATLERTAYTLQPIGRTPQQ
jgi:predicted DNA-binding protein YlxM (UPF0122 family)